MIVILSPSKTLDTDSPSRTQECSKPDFLKESKLLVSELQSYSANDLAKLMKVSDSIANLNVERFHNWRAPFNLKNAKQAMLMFKGDVFSGLDAETFTPKDDTFAQEHLRILSGLYGVLRPLDLMQPYRLEMGTKLTTDRGNTLYTFWGDLVTQKLNEEFLEVK
ncbi:MAG: YaaA family protein, partial [Chlamydiota bacterium]